MPETAEETAARIAAEAAAAAKAGEDAAAAAAAAAATKDEEQLGEAGKRALAAEREAAKTARAEAAAARAELEELRRAQMTDSDKALAAAKDAGKAEASGTFQKRILLTEVRVAAAGKLKDPGDAERLLDLSKFTVTDDGAVDTKAISEAIDELVKQKPYLAGATSTGGAGSGDQGARGAPPATLTREALSKMSQEEIRRLDPKVVAAALTAG